MTIETKYNIGDVVWLVRNGKAHHGKVLEIETKTEHRMFCKPITREYYRLNAWDSDRFWLDALFPSKQALLDSL